MVMVINAGSDGFLPLDSVEWALVLGGRGAVSRQPVSRKKVLDAAVDLAKPMMGQGDSWERVEVW